MRNWEPPSKLGDIIGVGRYGTVYSPNPGEAVKVVRLQTAADDEAKRAYRERVIGLIQSLLIWHSLSPHVVLHYGWEADLGPLSSTFTLHMERWEASLEQCGDAFLGRAESWSDVLFQILSALTCLSSAFEIVHNDLYPRNVLVRHLSCPHAIFYGMAGAWYVLNCSVMVAISDFGIASSPLLGTPDHRPEVSCPHPVSLPAGTRYSSIPLCSHVLRFYNLPPYSRDVYTVLKWSLYWGGTGLPRASTAAWLSELLRSVDKRVHEFISPAALQDLFVYAFSPACCARFGLPLRLVPGSPPSGSVTFSLLDEDKCKMLRCRLSEALCLGSNTDAS